MHYFVSILVSNHFDEVEKSGCFAIIVLQMHCYYKCSVAFPHGTVGWTAVCDYDHTHLLFFWFIHWLFNFISLNKSSLGVQWLSGRVLDLRPRGRGFLPHQRHCVVSLSKTH